MHGEIRDGALTISVWHVGRERQFSMYLEIAGKLGGCRREWRQKKDGRKNSVLKNGFKRISQAREGERTFLGTLYLG